LEPEHLSTYGLTFERGTQFWNRVHRGNLLPLPDDIELAMYEQAIDSLTSAGYEHYEVSNFARPGQRCRHNEVYWAGEEYFAAGPGAARYVGGRRETNHRSPFTYLKRVLAGQTPVAESEMLDAEDRAREQFVLGMRRLEGVHREHFNSRTGFTIDQLVGDELVEFVSQELVEDLGERIRLSRKGLMISDSLWGAFLWRKVA
jgi:oxygen-independent coproporphyrinogen-3 oxidase